MEHQAYPFVGLVILFGLVFGLMLIAYEDGVPFSLYKKLRCRFGAHKHKRKISKITISLYYCLYCKKERKHPPLKLVRGSKIELSDFKF